MPQSDHWAIPWVVEAALHLNPQSLLDFGVGNGQYGMQLRQHLDIAPGRLKPEDWEVTIDGIEVFDDYRNPIWDYFYDQVTIGDGFEYLKKTQKRYDLIVVCDVIEHFERDKALELLDLMRSRAETVVITTPNGSYPQGAAFGNEAERHLSEWRPLDFEALGASTRAICSTFLAVLSENPDTHHFVQQMPILFHYSGRELLSLTRQWFPRMLRKRLAGAT
jgi:hypothetical protein